MNQPFFKRTAISMAVGTILSGVVSFAAAQTVQTTAPATTADEPVQAITITGTSIRGIAPVGAELVKLSQEDIAASGATTGTELLRSVPELNNFNNTGNNTGSNQANFVDQPAIHGIGVGNGGAGLTLVLLDGHRLPGAGVNQTAPDAGGIPVSALQRVEVMADGGSSIYGSDAVAGVINFVTRRNFDGAETNLQGGDGNSYNNFTFSQLLGKNWEGGGGILDFEHTQNSALNGTARSYAVNNQTGVGGSDNRSSTCSPANITTASGASYAVSGNGTIAPGTNKCENDSANDLYPAQQRNTLFGSAHQNVSGDVELYGSFLGSDRKVQDHVAGDGMTNGPTSFSVPNTSPFYQNIPGQPGTQSVTYNPNSDFGPTMTNRVKTTTLSSVFGANFDLGHDWNVKTELNYGLERDDVRENGINQSLASADALNGTFNPYGIGTATAPSVLAAIGNYETRYFARQTIKEADAKADGPLFSIPGGAVKGAFGIDARKEEFQGLTSSGPVGDSVPTTTDASRTIESAFGEIYVPVVGRANQVAGIQKLDLSVAARFDHYSDVGNTTNPKLGVNWTVIDGAQIHASAGRSFHAPSLADSGEAIDTRAIQFPCTPGVFVGCANAGPSNYTVILAGGNPNLKPETANTFNLGFELSPSLLNGFKVNTSAFVINYNNVITFPGFGPVDNPLSAYDAYRTLRPAGSTDAEWLSIIQPMLAGFRHQGQIYPDVTTLPSAIYDLRRQNFADEHIRGIDYDFGYAFKNAYGRFNIDLAGTQMTRFDQVIPGVATPVQLIGTDYAIRTKFRTQFGMVSGNFAGSVFVNYTGSYSNTSVTPYQSVDSFTTADAHLAWSLHDQGLLGKTQLSLNVSNLTNKNPPVYYTTGTNGIVGFDPVAASPLGRVISVGLHKSW